MDKLYIHAFRFDRGMFCPVYNKVYYNNERDLPMIPCDKCNHKTHVGRHGLVITGKHVYYSNSMFR